MAKILLVEDDKSLREIYGVRLQAEGYEITSAGDGEEALAVAIKERPDLIVSDVMMPKISGFDMLDILRSTTETKNIKVIMMTALSSEDQRARGEALGADRYLVKSQVGIEDVVRTVHDVLGDGVATAPAAAPVAPAPVAPVPQPLPQPIVAPAPVAPVQPIVAPAPDVEPVIASAPAPTEAFTPMTPVQPVVQPMAQPVAQPMPAVAPAPMAAPVFAPTPVAPAPTPVTTLPAPTAPFSSDPPASLGDRIINPLPTAAGLGQPVADIASQMNQELNAHLQELQQPAAAPIAPQPAPMPIAPAPLPVPPLPPQPPIPPMPPQPGV
jgi:CheY-like chemotaxis protein